MCSSLNAIHTCHIIESQTLAKLANTFRHLTIITYWGSRSILNFFLADNLCRILKRSVWKGLKSNLILIKIPMTFKPISVQSRLITYLDNFFLFLDLSHSHSTWWRFMWNSDYFHPSTIAASEEKKSFICISVLPTYVHGDPGLH